MRIVFVLLLVASSLPAQNVNPQQTPGALLSDAKLIRHTDIDRSLQLIQRAIAALQKAPDAKLLLQAELMRCSVGMEQVSDSLLEWSQRTLAAARGKPAALAAAYACHGYALDNLTGEQNAALAYYDSAIAGGQKFHNDTVLAEAHVGRGELHYTRGDFVTSVSDLTLAYRLFTRMALPSRQAYALTALANLYADMRVGQYDKALEYYRQVLAVHTKSGNQAEIAATYFNIAGTLERKEKSEEALAYYRRALAIDQARNDPDEVAYDKRAIAVVLYHLNRPAEAIVMADEALAQFIKSGNEGLISMGRLTRGIALRMLGRYPEALKELETARSYYQRNDNNRFLEWTNDHLAQTYAAMGDWQNAYKSRVVQLDVQKKLNDQALDERTARMRVQFDAEKKDRDNRVLVLENAQIARVRQLQLIILTLASVLIVVLVAYAVRQVRHSRHLRITAMTDDLTGLPNRRHLLHVGEEHFRQVKGERTLGVLVLDIDHFKQINDSAGHAAGDDVLRAVASTLQSTLRGGDMVGRTGGDEFIVLLPGASRAVANEVADRIREAISTKGVTVSIGPAVSTANDKSLEQLIKRADEALYVAKNAGRNTVAFA